MTVELETIIAVCKSHCDRLGHLNHGQAVKFLERARRDWYWSCGLWAEGRARYGVMVVNLNVNYRRECFLGERLRVMTRVHAIGRKSFTLAQRVVKPDESVAIDAEATSVVMDLESRSTILVPSCIAAHLPPAL